MFSVRSVQSKFVSYLFRGTSVVAASLCISMFAPSAHAQYQRTDLVSNQAGGAPAQDQLLVNGWGLVSLANTPFWVSDNVSGFSTLYTGGGTQVKLFVSVPAAPSAAAGTLGSPTGVVGNISPNPADFTFKVGANSAQGIFIFATFDGTIVAWNPSPGIDPIDPTTHISVATRVADRSGDGAVYTGLAIAVNEKGEAFLYAADDGPNRRVDMFGSSFNFIRSFSDPEIPQDFAPYGIQAIDGQIWVTFTALNKAQGGFVDVFDTAGKLVKHFAVNGPLHSPWGIAKAPGNFGPMSNAILISNNTSRGRINAFNPETGKFLGPLRDASGKPIEINQLWAMQFGQENPNNGPINNGPTNQLFFTAGPDNYANGLFGTITPPK